jgi:hypothetical protein
MTAETVYIQLGESELLDQLQVREERERAR